MEQYPDPEPVLAGLKNFQRRTVDYVFQRLYQDEDATRRFLIADEVGLGKTLVARGLIACAVEHLWNQVGRIDIVYICSSADIARQNVNRLNITGNRDFTLPSRITLLPTKVQQLDQQRLNFISLTPSTSLDLKSSTGTWQERALLYHLLDKAWGLQGVAPLNVLQASMGRERFRSWTSHFEDWYHIDTDLEQQFADLLEHDCRSDRIGGKEDLRTRFERLCDEFRFIRIEQNLPEPVRAERNNVVGSLRTLLAKTCISSLEPDLIILDEFQRFKHLLESNSETGLLAQDLFNYTDEHAQAKVVLLSATPYKMYTIDEEQDEDHYKDFLRTVDFLLESPEKSTQFAKLLQDYRKELLRLHFGQVEKAEVLKKQIEETLQKIMVRTERLAVRGDRNGMLTIANGTKPVVQAQDISDYLALQNVARQLAQPDTLEFWKSAPYLLSFMEDYKLKRTLELQIALGSVRPELDKALSNHSELFLEQAEIAQYFAVDPHNARMRSLLHDTIDAGMWQLLWMPPCLPYYQLSGPFAIVHERSVTKRLVFSSWRVVPKAIATLASYAAERNMIRSFDHEDPENTVEARRRRRPMLRFARSEGRLSNMTTLGIIYPSFVLAEVGDPLETVGTYAGESEGLTAEQILKIIEDRIEGRLARLDVDVKEGGPVDESWYWAAPLMLDRLEDRVVAEAWFDNESLATDWSAGDENDQEEGDDVDSTAQSAWAEHVAMAEDIMRNRPTMGPKPANLVQVLAQMALSSPGIVALRALSRVAGGQTCLRLPVHRIYAGQIAWAFLTLYNLPESMALIRSDVWNNELPDNEPYWQRALRYNIAGNIQAVLDEYVHLLKEALGLLDQQDEKVAGAIKEAVRAALALRTVSLSVDDVRVAADTSRVSVNRYRLRSRFALRYGDSQSDDGKQGMRADQVRGAFNSPFWPFILATTSVGQEGLDFHMYCHAVVHWNLPSNPVDLEQREGRVHRYKGHAVRKNLAQVHRSAALNGCVSDPWTAMFEVAARESDTQLEPFWVYSIEGGAKIERHVPTLPLSRDYQRFIQLRKSLAVYRMVLGQSRQEDMLAYLMQNLPESEIAGVADKLRMNLEPPNVTSSKE